MLVKKGEEKLLSVPFRQIKCSQVISQHSILHAPIRQANPESWKGDGEAELLSILPQPCRSCSPSPVPHLILARGQKSHPSPQAWVAHQPAYRSSPGRSRTLGEAGRSLFLTDHVSQDCSVPMRDQSCPNHQLAFPPPLLPGFMALTRCQLRTGHRTL